MADPKKVFSHGIDTRGLHGKWGLISEKLCGDAELKEAVADVLAFEWHRITTGRTRPVGLPADIAYGRACHEDGQEEGIETAYRALLDREYIAGKREWIEQQNNDRKEQ